MKLFVFCIFAALCGIQVTSAANGLQILVQGIRKLKTNTNDIIQDLQRYQNTLVRELERKVHDRKFQSISEINTITNSALKDIEAAVAKAKGEGKDASSCETSAKSSLRELSLAAFKNWDEKSKSSVATLDPVLKNIESVISAAKNSLIYLDSIVPGCISSNTWATQSCVAGKLPAAHQTLKSLQSSSDLVKRTGTSLSNDAYQDVFRYSLQSTSDFRTNTVNIRLGVNRCIETA
ncbi:uncharacterized protein LOC105697789 [Orussus abietinus]|uniref:uncharacterized protein LOC105697789 n=1 Tax=Orussus abietinus TaxID=222816 RepID=UPI000626B316|nr:uncharacterized protein LOC105697789 [Orussus abietinus]